MVIEIRPDSASLAQHIAHRFTGRLAEIQAEGRRPSVVLTGGTVATAAYELIADSVGAPVDWTAVDMYWGDERFVPLGDSDRNDQQALDAFLTRVGVPQAGLHRIAGDDGSLTAAEAATAYAATLPEGAFDIVLLGMGPDGHVASLFPGFPQLHEMALRAVPVPDSPKPPPVRISLTYPVLNHADAVWFLVSGEGKAEAVARAHGAGTIEDTPAVGVSGLQETLWLLDEPAASLLP